MHRSLDDFQQKKLNESKRSCVNSIASCMPRSLNDFQERKAEEIYQRLRQQRKELEEEWQRKEKRRSEIRTTAKVGC